MVYTEKHKKYNSNTANSMYIEDAHTDIFNDIEIGKSRDP